MGLLSTALPIGRRLMISAVIGCIGAAGSVGAGLLAVIFLVRFQSLSIAHAVAYVAGVLAVSSAALLIWMVWRDPAGVHDERRFGRFFGGALTFFLSSSVTVSLMLQYFGPQEFSLGIWTGLYQLVCLWALFLLMEISLSREASSPPRKKKAPSN